MHLLKDVMATSQDSPEGPQTEKTLIEISAFH